MGSKKNHQDSAHQILQGLRDMKSMSGISGWNHNFLCLRALKEIFLQHSYTKNLSVPQAKQAWPKTELQKLYF